MAARESDGSGWLPRGKRLRLAVDINKGEGFDGFDDTCLGPARHRTGC
jgi:hypothetical protein